MKVMHTTGLTPEGSQAVVKGLEQLLADYHIFYMNLRGYHWGVKGPHFFGLHAKFEELYDSVESIIDEIAERLLQLDAMPCAAYSEYLKQAKLKEECAAIADREMVQNVLSAFKYLIATQREVIKAADAHADTATVDLLSGYLDAQEKTVWMLTAFLS